MFEEKAGKSELTITKSFSYQVTIVRIIPDLFEKGYCLSKALHQLNINYYISVFKPILATNITSVR